MFLNFRIMKWKEFKLCYEIELTLFKNVWFFVNSLWELVRAATITSGSPVKPKVAIYHIFCFLYKTYYKLNTSKNNLICMVHDDK